MPFIQGYGVGLAYIDTHGCCGIYFQNALEPISAMISGEEIVYEQVRDPSFESTGLGQVGQVRMGEGFDFSEGKNSESFNDFELEIDFDAFGLFGRGKPADVWVPRSPVLSSKAGVASLGKIDFGFLISKGIPPDLRLDFVTSGNPSEGYTYAVRSREGGVALLYIFDAERGPAIFTFGGYASDLEGIKFDWVYYPDGLPDAGTSVQPISWGQLKNSVLRTK